MNARPLRRAGRAWLIALLAVSGLAPAGCDSAPTEPGPTPAPAAAGRIAFTSWDGPNSSARIYLVDPDGTQLRALPLGKLLASFDAVSWAPDHGHVASSNGSAVYLSDTTSTSLVRLPLDSMLQRLTGESAYDHEPAWSPDGTRIAFTHVRITLRSENANNLTPSAWTQQACIARIDASTATCLDGFPGRASSPAWSPDGRKLVVAVQEGTPPATPDTLACPALLYVADADGTNAHAITTLPAAMRCGTRYGGDARPQWSPDGRWIVFTSDRAAINSSHVYIVDAAGTSMTQLTQTPAGYTTNADLSPVWSPDGSRIAYTHQGWTSAGKADQSGGVFVMHADGSNPTGIVSDVFATNVAWR